MNDGCENADPFENCKEAKFVAAKSLSPAQCQSASDRMPPSMESTLSAPGCAIPTGSRHSLNFPRSAERAFASMDDALIPPAQDLWSSPVLRTLFLGVTTLTAIESALPFPGALYALGYDAAAGLCTSVLLVLAVCSQIPKKFVWRPRPWMAGRGKGFRKDKTSSFPSRAVVCAVVFSWLATSSLEVRDAVTGGELPLSKSWLTVIILGALASLSRVCVGAHYPSDCICGFILGIAILKLGGKLETGWLRLGCSALSSIAQEIAQSPVPQALPLSLTATKYFVHAPSTVDTAVYLTSFSAVLRSLPWVRLVLFVTVAYGVTIASVAGFWVKCGYVYGLLFAPACFRYVFLAPAGTGVAVPGLSDHGSVERHVKVLAVFFIYLAVGMATRGKKGRFRLAAFTVIFLSTLGTILWCRLPT